MVSSPPKKKKVPQLEWMVMPEGSKMEKRLAREERGIAPRGGRQKGNL